MADHRDTLLLPFENGTLPTPKDGATSLFLNASVLPASDIDWQALLHCEQGLRPDFLTLQNQGYLVEPELAHKKNHTGAMVLAGRSRKLNEYNFLRAFNQTEPGGFIVFAGDKKAGAQAMRKWAAKHFTISGSLSKHHAIVFWVQRDGPNLPLPNIDHEIDGFTIAEGMFSASGPDLGSQVLAQHFDDRIRGTVADFGAGWGYLSNRLANCSKNVEAIELFEADWRSLQAAKGNVSSNAEFHWCDLTREAPRKPFNWVIMNPPFHTGRAAEPQLGRIFIQAAAKTLPSGGRLLMVANTNLPYEETLKANFKKVEKIGQDRGFKVIEAVR